MSLPILGFGASAIGNLYKAMSDDEAMGVLTHAIDLGVNYVDTAPHYGHGLSERRIGMVSPTAILSTKVGRVLDPIGEQPLGTNRHGFIDGDPFEPVFDYSFDGVMRSFADSCRRLGRDRIDILLVHDLGETTHSDAHDQHLRTFLDGGLRAMAELKAAGKIDAIGLGVNEWQVCETLARNADLDIILLAGRYTLVEQGALDSFLPMCEARGISVVIGGPFNSGVLVDQDKYNYQAVPPAIASRVASLKEVSRSHGVPLAAAALQFPLAHSSVVSVIPGMASKDEVETNLRYMTHPIPDGFWSELKSLRLLHPEAPVPTTTKLPERASQKSDRGAG